MTRAPFLGDRNSASILLSVAIGAWFISEFGFSYFDNRFWILRCVAGLLLILSAISLRRRLNHSDRLARTDELTELVNRRGLLETLQIEGKRVQWYGHCVSLALLDCDGFKQINDQQGHVIGDQVLRRIGHAIQQETRSFDHVGRLGGDEFLLILPDADQDHVRGVIERLRKSLQAELREEFPDLTFSIGVLSIPAATTANERDVDQMDYLNQVDRVMYAAKREGTDRTRYATFAPTNSSAAIK